MVIREDEDTIVTALSRIAEAIEDNSDILKGIKAHYDGVVPVMTRNAKRVEQQDTDTSNESALDKMYGTIFGTPKEENS